MSPNDLDVIGQGGCTGLEQQGPQDTCTMAGSLIVPLDLEHLCGAADSCSQ